jgi:type I site-specific restriction-modification system R (restriction) subunit
MITDINSEDRLVQKTFAEYLHDTLGWESVYAYNDEKFGPSGTLGRASEREVVLVRDLRAALERLNPQMPQSAREQALEKLARADLSRSLLQHNREFYHYIRLGVPVEWRDDNGEIQRVRAQVIDFRNAANNRFLAVRELKIQGVRVPHYNRRADLVCFLNGLPLVFIELKAVYLNIRAGFDNNLTDYLHEHSIAQAFHHNAFLVVSNGDRARYGSITSRVVMKKGFETPDGKRVAVDDAFKDPQHPFRIAVVCAMWLTGFDVECLSTLYIDKPMRAHTLMQAIARANRVYPGKDCGVIVDYNGVLKSLREALAQYALGDEDDGEDGGVIVEPIEELVKSLVQAIEAAENHLRQLGFEPTRLRGAKGFDRIQSLRDAVDAVYVSDEVKRRFEILARQVFIRFKALLMEPSSYAFAERHDNIEAIYKKLEEKRDVADVTEVLKELHKIVNEAIRAQQPAGDHAEGLTVDLSQIDFEKLRQEFAKKVRYKQTALQDIREVLEKKLQQMLARNPMQMDYYRKYLEIVAEYNREKDRVTVEQTFAELVKLANSLDAEQRRAAEEGLNDDEYALFQMLFRENISKTDREKLKQASKSLLASLRELLQRMPAWTKNSQTQAEVKVLVLDTLWQTLPRPPFTDQDTEQLAERVYDYVWQRSASEQSFGAQAGM